MPVVAVAVPEYHLFQVQVWRCLNIVFYLPVYVDKDSAYGVDVSVQGGQL